MNVTPQIVFDLDRNLNELDGKKSEIVFRKKKLEIELAELKNKVRSSGKMVDHEYKSLCRDQDRLKKKILSEEKLIEEIVREMRNKNILRDEIASELKMFSKKEAPGKLIDLKDFYINFAADKTRVGSMRAMAAEFAEKLEVVIKQMES